MEERLLYHSFPRRNRNSATEIENGFKVLSLIRNGLVLAPESLKWRYSHADGTPPRGHEIKQTRICFTELSPSELPKHAESFGHFALEFRFDTLKGLGAIPVFYIPQTSGEVGEGAELGSTAVMHLIDAMILVMRMRDMKKTLDRAAAASLIRLDDWEAGWQNPRMFSLDVAEGRQIIEALTYALTPPESLENAIAALLNLFYPADDVARNAALRYYRQREWRIFGNFAVKDEEVMRAPSSELIDRLLDIDAEFWGEEFPKGSGSGKRRAEEVFVYPGICGNPIIETVNRVIVPQEAVEKAKNILKVLKQPPPVVSLGSV
jgi:hypothetical protein